MTLRTWCDRSASIRSASVTGVIGVRGVEHPPAKVDPERRVAGLEGEVRVAQFGDASGLGALAARVDAFEDEEEASRHYSSSACAAATKRGVGLRALGDRGALGPAPVAFFAVAFFVVFLAVAFFARLLRRLLGGLSRSRRRFGVAPLGEQLTSAVQGDRLGRVAEAQRRVRLAVGDVEAESTGAHDDAAAW